MAWLVSCLALVVIAFIVRYSSRRAVPAPSPSPPPAPSTDPVDWTDAIDLGVAVLHHLGAEHDAAIGDALEAIGVEPWLARRLVTWIPAASAQQVLSGMTHLDGYSDGAGSTRRMSEDPIFRAARGYAREVGAARALGMAERSASMNAVRTGNETADLASLATLDGRIATALVTPLPPIAPGDGGVPEARALFRAFFDAHGHPSVSTTGTAARVGALEVDAFVVPHQIGPRFRAQFDFVVRDRRLAGGRLIESFVGEGASYRAAVMQAVDKLRLASVHVIIATLLDHASCGDQVSWERWEHPGGAFDRCLGLMLVLWADIDPKVAPLLDALRAAVEREPLTREIHTLRVFAARDGTKSLADEVLLDGEPWPAGEALCRDHAWPVHERGWGARLFLMLAPVPRTEPRTTK